MEQFGQKAHANAGQGAALAARGLLLVLAAPSVAAMALDGSGRTIVAALRMLSDIFTIPAFFAVAGWLAAGVVAAPRLAGVLRAGLPAAACGLASAFLAFALGPLAGLDGRAALAQAEPIWSLALLPVGYALVARAFGPAQVALVATAIVAHVFGVILGKPSLIHAVFFAAGLLLAARRDALQGLVRDEPEFAVAAGPFLAVLAAAVAVRFSQTGQAPSLAALGPIALALGLAAGAGTLATALALAPTACGEPLARLGRVAPAVALFWAPLFSILIAAANRGLAPSPASAMLMAVASLLLIAVLADIVLDISEKAGFRRAPAHS